MNKQKTLSEKIEAIQARFSKRSKRKPRIKQRRESVWKSKLTQARQRRERLENEKFDWLLSALECMGEVKAIGEKMGYVDSACRRALWDLGLWPLVVRLRERTGKDARLLKQNRPKE